MGDPIDPTPKAQREAEWLRGPDDLLTDFWRPLIEFAERSMLATGTLSPGEIELELTDDPQAAVDCIQRRLAGAR
jgi:hypothetical protein